MDKPNTIRSCLSKRRARGFLLLGLAFLVLAACATGKEAELRRLRARAAYDLALAELCLDQTRPGPCEPRIPAALASLQEAISLNPEAAVYLNTLGFVHLNLKNLPQAMEAFERALQLSPDYADANYYMGVALAEAGRWEAAIRAYRKALAIPTYAHPESVYTNMGWAYYNLDRLGEAESALRQAIRLYPALEVAHYHLGLVLLKAGRREEARGAFRRVREIAPDSEFGRAAREHLKAFGEGQ